MKALIILLLFKTYMIECTTLGQTRCKPGDIKVDACSNICRCLGDGAQTTCTKIFCPAFEKIPPSPKPHELWENLFTISKNSGILFKPPRDAKHPYTGRATLLLLK